MESTLLSQTPSPEPRLEYSPLFERWQGEYEYPEGGILLIWMDHATFHRYVATYLDTLHITSPTTEQQEQAIQHCRQLSFWHNITDQQVHIRQFGHISKGKRL